MSSISRRRLLLLAVAGIGTMGAGTLAAIPVFAAASNFSAIVVDVSAMRGRGFGIQADWIEQDLVRALKKRFASRLARNAPRLLVEVTSVSLGSYADNDRTTSDFLEGSVMVVDRSGKVRTRRPILLALPSASTGTWYLPDVDRMRITSLCNTFADWVARYTR